MEDITTQHIIAAHRLNLALSDFVRSGLRNLANTSEATIDTLMGYVAQVAMDTLDGNSRMNGGRAQRSKRVSPPEVPAEDAVYDAYVKFVSKHYLPSVAAQPPLTVNVFSLSKQAAIAGAAGRKYEELPQVAVDDNVEKAWALACHNSRHAYQQLGALFFLASQTPRHLSSAQKTAFDVEVNAAMTVLFRAASGFEATEMKFAILLGGKALAATRQKVIEKSFGQGMSLVQYLHPGEALPGRYESSTEQDFRAKIAEYAIAAQ